MTCSIHYFVENPCPTNAKIIDIVRCKLWALSKHVNIYDTLRTSLNEAPFSIKLTARPSTVYSFDPYVAIFVTE